MVRGLSHDLDLLLSMFFFDGFTVVHVIHAHYCKYSIV